VSCYNHNADVMNPVVRLLAALSLVVAACLSPAAYALDTGDIVVTSIKGEVHVTVNGAARAMKAGSVLETPAAVRTGRDGTIELKQGATTVSVGPETLLEFPAQERRGGAIDRIVQPRGNAFYSIGKREGRKLRVETPYLVGVIKGTQFNVASQDESTTISLFEGRLEVHATDESDVVDLNAGEIATRKRGDKSITVMKMDGKLPTTAPRPSSPGTGGNGTPAAGGSGTTSPSAPRPADGDDGDSLLAGGVRANPVISTTVDTPNGAVNANANAGVSLDVRANSADLGAGADVGVAGTNANVAAGVNVGASGVDAGATVNVATPVAGLDTGVNVAVGASGVDANVNLNATTPVATVDVGAGVNVGTAGVAVDVGAAVIVAPLGTDITNNTSLGVTPGALDLTTSTGVNAGAVAADLGVNAGVSAGASGIAVDTTTTTAVNAGPVAADLGTSTAVNVGTSGISTAVDAGVAASLGTTPVVDTRTSVAADVGTTTAVAVDTSTSVAGVNTGIAAAVNATAGTVDLGLSVAGVNIAAGVDLGTSSTTTTTTTTPAPPAPAPPVIDVGGLLDGLLRRRSK
jgi:hypothetical protein